MKPSDFTTNILAEYISGLSPAMIPATAFETVKKCIIDIVAASLAGFNGTVAARKMAGSLFSSGTSSVWFSGETLNAPGAAYINSSSASALDLDDGHRKAMGHPGAAIIPAALAVAEETCATGIDFLTAVVIGYEIGTRVAAARNHEHLETMSSGKWTPYGVAATAGWLYKLSPSQLAQALSIAGVQAPELSASGYSKIMGNNVKEGIPWSVVTGLSAVQLARNNYSGPLDILDYPKFYDSKKIVSGLGKHYAVDQVYFKPYACCRWIHSAIDALFTLMDTHSLSPEQISGIDAWLFKRALMLTNQTDPETLEGAQYSVQYAMGVAALDGKGALCPMTSRSIGRKEIISFAEKITLHEDLELSRLFPDFTPARIVIHSTKGTFEKFVKTPLGDPGNPMDLMMIKNKINLIAGQNACEGFASEIIDAVEQLERHGVKTIAKTLGQPLKQR